MTVLIIAAWALGSLCMLLAIHRDEGLESYRAAVRDGVLAPPSRLELMLGYTFLTLLVLGAPFVFAAAGTNRLYLWITK